MSNESVDVRGWPGLWLAGDHLRLGLVPQLGGRICSAQHDGEELLFVDERLSGVLPDIRLPNDDKSALADLKTALGFQLWGGNKLWVAPEAAWIAGTPPLDLDAGCYGAVTDGQSVTMISPVCRETGVRLTRRVELTHDDCVVIDQRMENCGEKDVAWGMWDVTQWLRPFDVYVAARRDRLRPYELGDSARLFDRVVQEANNWTRVVCDDSVEFKFGGIAERGRMIAVRAAELGALVVDVEFPNNSRGEYAHDSSVEVYNSSKYPYLELETHRQREVIPPGGSVEFREQWHISRVGGPFGPEALPPLVDA